MIDPKEVVDFKLSLAKAWLENGQEALARGIIGSIIEKADLPEDE